VGYYLLVLSLQIVLPYASTRFRTIVTIIVIATGFPGILYSLNSVPIIDIPKDLNDFLTVSNIYLLAVGTMVQLSSGNIVKSITEQITEDKMDTLSALANTDPLTGLFNRRYAESYFTNVISIRSGIPYCVAMMDIDDFKYVNDTYGHQCGDEVLVSLAGLISKSVRKSDIVFRWGGEEFLLVLENVELPTAYTILDKFRSRLAETTIKTAVADIRITVTIGAAVLDPENPFESIKRSDENLYIGKKKKNILIAG
jgi:diguanylate cyclase (GGDEF)-like protein